MAFESIAHVIPATVSKTEKVQSAKTPPAKPADSGKPVTAQQIENIQSLWKRLEYGPEQMTKLFAWLDAEALECAEHLNDLTMDQAARAIGLPSKKAGKEAPRTSPRP